MPGRRKNDETCQGFMLAVEHCIFTQEADTLGMQRSALGMVPYPASREV